MMKKRILCLAAAVCAASMTACGGSDAKTETTAPATTAAQAASEETKAETKEETKAETSAAEEKRKHQLKAEH